MIARLGLEIRDHSCEPQRSQLVSIRVDWLGSENRN